MMWNKNLYEVTLSLTVKSLQNFKGSFFNADFTVEKSGFGHSVRPTKPLFSATERTSFGILGKSSKK